MKTMKILLALLWSCSSALAFTPAAGTARHRRTEISATSSTTTTTRRQIIWGTAFGIAGAAAATVSSVAEAEAAGVKELDMALPSYGDIKSPKASVENVKSLSVDTSKGGGSLGISSSQKKRGAGGDDKKKKEQPKKEKTDAQGYIF